MDRARRSGPQGVRVLGGHPAGSPWGPQPAQHIGTRSNVIREPASYTQAHFKHQRALQVPGGEYYYPENRDQLGDRGQEPRMSH